MLPAKGINCLSILLFVLFIMLLLGLIYWCFKPNRLHVDLHMANGGLDSSPIPFDDG